MASRVKRVVRKVRSSREDRIKNIANSNPVEEGHPSPPVGITKPYRRVSLGLDKKQSNIKKEDLMRLKDKQFILDDIRLTIPGPNELVLSFLASASPSIRGCIRC